VAIRSMTGYGQAALETDALRAAVSVRSLNHRFLEVGLNLSRRVQSLEPEVKGLVQARLQRGKVELSLRASFPDGEVAVVPQGRIIAGAVAALRAARAEHGLSGDVGVAEITRFPGAFEVVEAAEALDEGRRRSVLDLVQGALDGLEGMRRAEGERLAGELGRLLDVIEAAAAGIDRMQAEAREARRAGLLERARELASELGLEDARVQAEVVRAADRLDVSEEIQRLRSHVALARELMAASEPQGKRLDFVAQEMAREANTVGSKAGHAPLVHAAIALKAEIERFREQVQNVE
jgi:uncharacterized protein (TIGR00255 family)